MNIKKLITDLQVCADEDILCPACERYGTMGAIGGGAECVERLLREAAATLEEMQKRISEAEEKGRWIPVTERLPEPEKRILILTRCKGWNGKEYREIMCGFYEDGNVWCEDSKATWDYELKREENYDEERDDYTVPKGWFEELVNHIDDYNCVMIGEPVTHWMPLPEPPKEVE